jgi:hypothetical protein
MNNSQVLFKTKNISVKPKITALLLILAMVVSLLPMTVLADGVTLAAPVIQTILVPVTLGNTLEITFNKNIAAVPAAIDLNQTFKVKQGDTSLGIAGCALKTGTPNVLVISTVIAMTATGTITIRYDADEGKIVATDGARVRSFKKVVPYFRDASAPKITTQPENIKVKVGELASLSVVVAPVTALETLTYQWYKYSALSNKDGLKVFTRVGELIPGATAATYTPVPTAVAGKTYYYCIISHTDPSALGQMTTTTRSHSAKVIVFTKMNAETPKITTQPTGAKVNVGAPAVNLTVAAAPVAAPGVLSYQWYKYVPQYTRNESNPGKFSGITISGATAPTYAAPAATAGITYYYCVVTNTDTTMPGKQKVSVKSAVVKVNVVDPAAETTVSTRPGKQQPKQDSQNNDEDRDRD